MKHYDVYLFDFDYTLVNSSKGIVMSFRHVLNLHKYTGISDDDIKRTIGKTLENAFSILTGVTDLEILESYRVEYVKMADVCMTQNTVLFPETKEVLSQLKSRGAKIGIISSKYRYCIMELLEERFPKNFFDIVIGIEDVEASKPSPEGLFSAIESLKGELQNTLYIGDSIIDAQTANAAGTDFIGVLHGTTTHEEFIVYPHIKIVQNLNALI